MAVKVKPNICWYFAQDSEDTNVLVLLIRWYPKLPRLSFVV